MTTICFSRFIQLRRKFLLLEQTDLAALLNRSEDFVSQIERGVTPSCRMRAEIITALAPALKVSPASLLAWAVSDVVPEEAVRMQEGVGSQLNQLVDATFLLLEYEGMLTALLERKDIGREPIWRLLEIQRAASVSLSKDTCLNVINDILAAIA